VLELLNNPISTCSQKVRLCLHEKGLAFTDTKIDFRKKEHLAPEYLKLNPNGVVPTLLHDGRPIVDSSVIVEYLEEVFPRPRLSPAAPYERASMRAWLRYIEEVPTTAIRVPSFNKVFVRHYRDLDEAALEANADDRPLRKHFYKEMGATGFADEKFEASVDRLRDTVTRMETALAKTEWLNGEDLSLADYCVVPTIDRMRDLGMAGLWEEKPHFRRWWKAIQARPAYRATYYPGTRVSELYPDLGAAS
jgi:glutathione S-transferase